MEDSDPFEYVDNDNGGIDYYRIPCGIEDAAGMLRIPLNKNDKPYVNSVKKLNNRLVDEYLNVILTPMANKKGQVPSGKVCIVWEAFHQRKQICNIVPLADKIVRPDQSQFAYWLQFLRQDIEKLHPYGMTVTMVWGLIMNEVRHRVRQQKWERIYSHPLNEWHRLFNKEKMLVVGELQLPCSEINQEELKDIEEKLAVLQKLNLTAPVEQRIEKNERPLVKLVKELNNALVAEFRQLFPKYKTAIKLPEKNGAQLSPEDKKKIQIWNLFREGRQLNEFLKLSINLPRATHEQLLFWGTFLQQDIEQLHPYGGHFVAIGHGTLLNEIRYTMSEKKVQKVFSPPESEWEKLFEKHWDYLNSKPEYLFSELITEENLLDVGEKMRTLQQIRVDPNNTAPSVGGMGMRYV